MFHLLFGPLFPGPRSDRLSDLGAIGIRLVRAGVHTTDPRLICEAASGMLEVMRQIARVIRCREWLGQTAPPEALELQGAAGLGAQQVAESARLLATTGSLAKPDGGDSIRIRAEELYARGVARAFESADALDVLRQKTLYDALLGVVIGSDRAMEALRDASIE